MVKTITAYSKPKHCPACGSKHIESILYNKPFVAKPATGEICENEITPKWHCSGCGVKIYLKTSRRCRLSSGNL
jgi:hypothetical protein